ncbi:hypothetical protein RIR_jg22728.t3 [Rhizophagus irregularis DAOM 181602=DAOM 197198]|nr:hypothetical protein RIR_jg22728.t3 [Rhizophagus irregularis DAOM 181602=DAOM 197198]
MTHIYNCYNLFYLFITYYNSLCLYIPILLNMLQIYSQYIVLVFQKFFYRKPVICYHAVKKSPSNHQITTIYYPTCDDMINFSFLPSSFPYSLVVLRVSLDVWDFIFDGMDTWERKSGLYVSSNLILFVLRIS